MNNDRYEYEVIYYWFHHMLFSFDELEQISKVIQDGDHQTFRTYYLTFGDVCFPETASIVAGGEIIGEINVTYPEGFSLITYNECESG